MMTIGDYKNFNSNGKNMVYGICYKSHCICGKNWFSLKYRLQPISMMRNDLWLNSRKRMLGWKRSGVQKKKRWVSSCLFFFFRLLFGLLGDFVCCRCCCCFLLYLLCFFTLHGCYLKVTYKEHIIHDHFSVGYFHVCAILIPFYRCPYSTAHLSLINCHFLLCSSSIERLSRHKLKNVLDVNYRILFCVPDGNSES